ncbi:MAG: glycosyltransferase [Candidatus Fermentibacteraceae bacterium]
MKVAFVVPVTRPDDARTLAATLYQRVTRTGSEVVLVTESAIAGLPPKSRCIETRERHASVRRNLGVKDTTAEWIVFLDDDTLPTDTWFEALENALDGSDPIVTGPTIPMGNDLEERLSDLVTTSALGEGSMLYGSGDGSSPGFSSIYLCNCLVKREVWERAGGFNELADWRVDDTEFFYIALRLGFRPVFRRAFTVRHRRRGFFHGFLPHQFKARYATGMNTVLFPEIFLRIPGVLAMLLGLALAPVLLAVPRLLNAGLLLYGFALLLDTLLRIPRDGAAALLPVCHPIHHVFIATGFTLGLLHTIFTRRRHRTVLAHRAERYGAFR